MLYGREPQTPTLQEVKKQGIPSPLYSLPHHTDSVTVTPEPTPHRARSDGDPRSPTESYVHPLTSAWRIATRRADCAAWKALPVMAVWPWLSIVESIARFVRQEHL